MSEKDMNISPTDKFEEAINVLRESAPLVGVAALSGKTSNLHLHKSWEALQSVGVKLERGTLNYMWGDLRKTSPKLAHSVEEVLIFGDALFSAIARRESPETLRDEFIDVKQRFAKVIKETEEIASPKEERRLFSFFSQSNSDEQNNKTALRIDNLDELLNQAHEKSKELLEKTEKDIFIERGFQNAVGAYILALEEVQEKLDKESRLGGELSKANNEIVTSLKNTLLQSVIMTKNNFEISKSHLQTKAALHDTSISFLTMHENTFTFIQGQLHALSDIKKLTDTMNSLSDVVNAGSTLISSASVGVEKSIIDWNEPFVSRDTLKKLSSGFDSYDKTVNNLISRLTPEGNQDNDNETKGPILSHWDNLDEVKRELIEPILNRDIKQDNVPVAQRPTRRCSNNHANPINANMINISSDDLRDYKFYDVWLDYDTSSNLQKEEEVSPPPPAKTINEVFQISSSERPWNKIQSIVAENTIKKYNDMLGVNMSPELARFFGWSAIETVARLSSTITKLDNLDVKSHELPALICSKINYITLYENPLNEDFEKIVSERPVVFYEDEWKKDFISWHSKFDDLDYSYIMQWNELVYDLLILEEDKDQRKQILSASIDSDKPSAHTSIKTSLINRIKEFATDCGLESSKIREWSFSGLILRYGIELGIDFETLKPLWDYWYDPANPIDWDGNEVSSWDNIIENKDKLNDFINNLNSTYSKEHAKLKKENNVTINAEKLKRKIKIKKGASKRTESDTGLSSEDVERLNTLNMESSVNVEFGDSSEYNDERIYTIREKDVSNEKSPPPSVKVPTPRRLKI